jgi:hypothetical protein
VLQAGRSPDRFLMGLLNYSFFNLPKPPSCTDLSPRVNEYQKLSLASNALPARKADNLTAICESIISKILDSQHLRNLLPFQGLLQE